MKKKYILWTVGGILLLAILVIGTPVVYDLIQDMMRFEKTTICEDTSRPCPKDTTFVVKGVEFKMVGIRGGSICCEEMTEKFDLRDFYLGETEVTQELWDAVMEVNPSNNKDSTMVSLPVEDIDLVECLQFVHKLDSITGKDFYIPTYPQWLYAAYLGEGPSDSIACTNSKLDEIAWYRHNSDSITHQVKQKKPNKLGLYDMTGNVAEWTISGSDPLFFVMGGSFSSKNRDCNIDQFEVNHANIRMSAIGLRLVLLPKDKKQS